MTFPKRHSSPREEERLWWLPCPPNATCLDTLWFFRKPFWFWYYLPIWFHNLLDCFRGSRRPRRSTGYGFYSTIGSPLGQFSLYGISPLVSLLYYTPYIMWHERSVTNTWKIWYYLRNGVARAPIKARSSFLPSSITTGAGKRDGPWVRVSFTQRSSKDTDPLRTFNSLRPTGPA